MVYLIKVISTDSQPTSRFFQIHRTQTMSQIIKIHPKLL